MIFLGDPAFKEMLNAMLNISPHIDRVVDPKQVEAYNISVLRFASVAFSMYV